MTRSMRLPHRTVRGGFSGVSLEAVQLRLWHLTRTPLLRNPRQMRRLLARKVPHSAQHSNGGIDNESRYKSLRRCHEVMPLRD